MSKITENELQLLKICWEKGETITRDIYEESLKYRKRTHAGVKTILEVMVGKEFLNKRMIGRTTFYSPNVSKKKLFEKLINDFVNNFLNGSVFPVFIQFIKKQN